MAARIPSINLNTCMACRICVSACPVGCLSDEKVGIDTYNKAYPVLVAPETCTGCGICAGDCPVTAIVMVDS